MEIINRGLHAFKGFSDEPLSPQQENDLEIEQRDIPQQYSPQENEQEKPPLSPSDEIVIDFTLDGGSPMNSQREPQAEEINNHQEGVNQDDIEQVDPQYVQAVQNIIKRFINGVLKWNIVCGFVIISLLFTMKWKSAYLYTFVLISLIDVYGLFSILQKKPEEMYNQNPISLIKFRVEKQRYFMNILQKTLALIATAGLVFYVYIWPFTLTYVFAPTLLFDFCYAFFLAIKYQKHFLKSFYNVQLLLKGFVLALVSCITLKVDNFIDWDWREVFLSFWIFFGLLVGLTLIITLAFFDKILNFFFPERRNFEVYGLLWLVLILLGTSTLSCLIVLKLQNLLQNKFDEGNPFVGNSLTWENGLSIIFLITAVYNIFLVLYTTTHIHKIEKFFKKVTVIEEEVRPQSPSSAKTDAKQNQGPKKLIIPRFLARSSNTYFRKVTQDDINKSKQKQPLREKGKSMTKKAKPVKYLRKNSLDSMGSKKPSWLPEVELQSNGDLNTILETDREKIELTARNVKPKLNVKPLNLGLRKLSEITSLGLTSQPSDRSRANLILSSTRSGLNLASENYFISGQSSPTVVSSRCKKSDRFEESISSPLSIHRNPSTKIEADDGSQTEREIQEILEDEEIPQTLTKRRANSLIIIPEAVHFDIEGITEAPEVKEVSKIDISGMITSPAGEASAVQTCLICFDNGPDAVFMECGHGGVCYECSLEIWKTTAECYLCRKFITQVLQIDSKQKIGKDIIKVISATQMV